MGGPDGGSGGDGGSVYIAGDDSLNTLLHLSYYSILRAGPGKHGGGNKKQGARGEDLEIRVPLGTTIWQVKDSSGRGVVGDVLDNTPLLVCKGGKGGRGNSRFTTAVNQTPLLAEAGEAGAEATLVLELKLLADVGIIGMPNSGKSTLLAACSAAKPKVADYPFTTIDPVLGMVEYQHSRFLLVEVPGLIEGAHHGVGLGHTFLRHAERTRLLWHLVDGTSHDIMDRVASIDEELRRFSPELANKPQVLVINKMDVTEAKGIVAGLSEELKALDMPVFYVSAATRQGVQPLIGKTLGLLEDLPRQRPEVTQDSVPRIVLPLKERKPEVWKEGQTYIVDSPRVNKLVAMANLRDSRVRLQLWRELERMGVAGALERRGVKAGDTVRLGKIEMEWE